MSDTASKDSARQYGGSLPDLSKLTLGPGETSEDKLSHLLPNEYGSLSQPLANGETLGLNWISANYLKKSAHPTWMTDSLKTGVIPAQTLIEAIGSTNVNIRLAKCMKTYALCHIPVTSASLLTLHKSNK